MFLNALLIKCIFIYISGVNLWLFSSSEELAGADQREGETAPCWPKHVSSLCSLTV